jgi:histidyl-tRNA synthetase
VLKINNRKLLNGLMDRADVADPGSAWRCCARWTSWTGWAGGRALAAGRGAAGRKRRLHQGGGLTGEATEAVLAFTAAGGGSRGATLDRLDAVVGGSEEGRAGLEELAAIGAALDAMGVGEDRALVDPSVVRGLEYYTGPVFEAELLMETAGRAGDARSPGLGRRRRTL